MKVYVSRSIVTLFVFLFFILITFSILADTTSNKADPENSDQVKRGRMIYTRFCSLCHGRNLEGQPNWRKRKPDGKLPAPPHDETGHTWHHADRVLFDITKNGLKPPNAPPGYQSDMPAWKDILKDEDIWAVLAFIKSRWPAEQKEYQQKVNSDYNKQYLFVYE